MARTKLNNSRGIPNKFDPVEGTFYERVFSPTQIKVEKLGEDDKTVKLTLKDDYGQKLEVIGGRLVRIVCRLLRPWTQLKLASEVYALREDPKKLESVLQNALTISRRGFKAYFDKNKKLVGIASEIHKQISWKQIRKIVEKAIKKAYGIINIPEGSPIHPSKWTYQMPSSNKDVSAWITVNAGNNLVKGHSGIRVWARFRTERGTFRRPACLNWSGMWEVPLTFFGLKTERLDTIEGIEVLNMKQFHLSNAITNETQFTEDLAAQIKNMNKVVKRGILPIIKESRKVKLTRTEMEAILSAYAEKVELPQYIVKQILEHIEENTVWGFSQAVSWVRTHGEFQDKKAKLPREDRRLTQNLENIAGEVLSITPTIKKLHKILGKPITKRVLVNPQKIRKLRPMVA